MHVYQPGIILSKGSDQYYEDMATNTDHSRFTMFNSCMGLCNTSDYGVNKRLIIQLDSLYPHAITNY